MIFKDDTARKIAEALVAKLNSLPDFLSASTVKSTRAAGDALQELTGQHLRPLLGELCTEYSEAFARRAMADLAFSDRNGNYYVVDVKTHRQGVAFSMPNLTSVERLSRFYEDDTNYFCLLMLVYDLDESSVTVKECHLHPIEHLDWDCLTLGALGWGQIQIANARMVRYNSEQSRVNWMIELCDRLLAFYPKEIGKINERIAHFEKIRETWLQRRNP